MRNSLPAVLLFTCSLLAACEPPATTEPPGAPAASGAALIATAAYDAALKAPRCTGAMSACDSGGLLLGRAGLGPEPNQPNTLGAACADGTTGVFHSDESIDSLRVTTVDGSDFAPGKSVRVDATVWAYSTADALDVYAADSASSPTWTLVGTVATPGTGQRVLSVTYPLTSGAVQAVRAQFRWGSGTGPCTAGVYNDHDDLSFDVNAALPPAQIVITSPADRASLTRIVTIVATPTPGFVPTSVEILVDGWPYTTLTSPPYTLVWDTMWEDSSQHQLTARANVASGPPVLSAPVNVTVHNLGIAEYDPGVQAPKCADLYRRCMSQRLLWNRGTWNEKHQPNTLDGCQDGTVYAPGLPRFIDYIEATTMNGGPFAPGRQVQITTEAYTLAMTDQIDIWWAQDALNPQWTLVTSLPPLGYGGSVVSTLFTPLAGTLQAIRASVRSGSVPRVPCGAIDTDWEADDLVIGFASEQDADVPAVSSLSPSAYSSVHGSSVQLQAFATGPSPITSFDYFDDTTLIGSAAPGTLVTWNMSGLPDGPRAIVVVAHDSMGRTSLPYIARLTIDQTPPAVAMLLPLEGATISGTVTLKATATDANSLNEVTFYNGSTLLGTATWGPNYTFTFSWNTATVPNGAYTLTARGRDAAYNVGVSVPVHVTVANGSSPGNVAIYDPNLHAPKCNTASSQCDSGSMLIGRGLLGPEPNQPNTLLMSSCADGNGGSFHGDESLDRLVVTSANGQPLARGQGATIAATAWVWGAGDYLDLYVSPAVSPPAWTYLTTLTPTAAAGLQTLTASFTVPAGSTTQAIRGQFRYGGTASPPGTACTTSPYDDRDDLVFTVQ